MSDYDFTREDKMKKEFNDFLHRHRIITNWDNLESVPPSSAIPVFRETDHVANYIEDKTYGFWNKKNIKLCPKTVNLFKPFKNVESISVSILDPGKHIPAHNGPYKGILRYQLALSVPKDGSCQIFVDNKPYSWTEGKSVLFDDTFIHEVKNKSNEKRIALLLDIRRNDLPFFLKIYDYFFFKIIQLIVLVNRTMEKSAVS